MPNRLWGPRLTPAGRLGSASGWALPPAAVGSAGPLDVSSLLTRGQSEPGRVTPSLWRLQGLGRVTPALPRPECLWTCHPFSLKAGATLDLSPLLSQAWSNFGRVTSALWRLQGLWMYHPCSLEAAVPLDVSPLLSRDQSAFGCATPALWRLECLWKCHPCSLEVL